MLREENWNEANMGVRIHGENTIEIVLENRKMYEWKSGVNVTTMKFARIRTRLPPTRLQTRTPSLNLAHVMDSCKG